MSNVLLGPVWSCKVFNLFYPLLVHISLLKGYRVANNEKLLRPQRSYRCQQYGQLPSAEEGDVAVATPGDVGDAAEQQVRQEGCQL